MSKPHKKLVAWKKSELDTQIEIVRRIGYLGVSATAEIEALIDECLAVTYGLRKSLN